MVRPGAPQCLSVSVVKFANVQKCPVLSGLLNAISVLTINPLYPQDLQQFPPCTRPDIPDIRPKKRAHPLRVRPAALYKPDRRAGTTTA